MAVSTSSTYPRCWKGWLSRNRGPATAASTAMITRQVTSSTSVNPVCARAQCSRQVWNGDGTAATPCAVRASATGLQGFRRLHGQSEGASGGRLVVHHVARRRSLRVERRERGGGSGGGDGEAGRVLDQIADTGGIRVAIHH